MGAVTLGDEVAVTDVLRKQRQAIGSARASMEARMDSAQAAIDAAIAAFDRAQDAVMRLDALYNLPLDGYGDLAVTFGVEK